jgi:hypothetical protein
VSFLLRWLGLDARKKPVGLHPHRDVELAVGYDGAYARVLEAIELALGANVTLGDKRSGRIEAAFGIVGGERIACSLRPVDRTRTAVRIEAIFPAAAEVPERSRAADALADYLSRAVEPAAMRSNPA